MKFDLIFFDLDGTLIHSGPDIATSLNLAFRDVGIPQMDVARIIGAIGGGLPTLVERTIGKTHPEKQPQVLERVRIHYAEHMMDTTELYPGVRETLQRLGGVRVMVTNKPEGMTRTMIAKLGIEGLFARVYGGDTLPVRKPDPAALVESLKKFGVAGARALMVGDSGVDIETAARAGVRSCAVTYGYSIPGELDGADITIWSFAELVDVTK